MTVRAMPYWDGLIAEPVLHELAWPAVLLGNLLAAAGMACYFRLRHPNFVIRP